MEFNLTKYLAEGKLYENASSEEQDIVDDILSVTEGLNDIINKMKNYAKKGLLTAAIIASVVGQLKAQGQTDLANQVEKQSTELVDQDKTEYKYGAEFLNLDDIFYGQQSKVSNEIPFTSKRGEQWGSTSWDWQPFFISQLKKGVKIEGVKYNTNVFKDKTGSNIFKLEYVNTKTKEINPNLSFYFTLSTDLEAMDIRKQANKDAYSKTPIGKLTSQGWQIKQTTKSGNRKVVILQRYNSYKSLTFKDGELVGSTDSKF